MHRFGAWAFSLAQQKTQTHRKRKLNKREIAGGTENESK
jgi:hypothetical protein